MNPGDGGWGLISDLQGYKVDGPLHHLRVGHVAAQPAQHGRALARQRGHDDEPDQRQHGLRSVHLPGRHVRGGDARISASIAWRMEGVPRYDLIGRSEGFRRPGVEMYWEPGITVMSGRHAISLNVPIGYYFNRFRNPNTATRGDSTFPEYVAIATYSMRFGAGPRKRRR